MKCESCGKDFKRIASHRCKVTPTEHQKNVLQKYKRKSQFSKLDLISIIQVKIQALEDVVLMLRAL